MRKLSKVFLMILGVFLVCSCSNSGDNDCDANKYEKNPVATIVVKDYGTMKYELFINNAPQSVANFTELANSGFYDNKVFHRLDQDLGIIQGGDPSGDGTGGPGYSIKGEFTANNHCNDLKNEYGTIAMARSQENDSGGSQFFINFKNNTRIFENNYAVFGKIIEGEDILNKFSKLETKENNGMMAPVKKITIESIKVDTFDQKMPEINKLR